MIDQHYIIESLHDDNFNDLLFWEDCIAMITRFQAIMPPEISNGYHHFYRCRTRKMYEPANSVDNLPPNNNWLYGLGAIRV